MSASELEDHAEAGAHHRLVVGEQDADGHQAPVAGKRARTEKPAPRAGLERAAVERDALAHPDQAVAAAVGRPRGPRVAAVDDLDLELRRGAPQTASTCAPGACLSTLVSASWRIRNAASARPAGGRPGRPPRAARRRARRAAARPPGRRRAAPSASRRLGLGAVRAQDPEQPPHLADRVAPGPLDREQRLALALLLRRQQPPHGARLQAHHADAVADHVVQLACDPRPLGLHRRLRPLVALALELGGARLEHVDLEAHRPRRATHEQRDRDGDRVERELVAGHPEIAIAAPSWPRASATATTVARTLACAPTE